MQLMSFLSRGVLEWGSACRFRDLRRYHACCRAFLDEWIKAVNTKGGFGEWSWAVSFNPGDISGILDKA